MASRAEGIHPPTGKQRNFSRRELFTVKKTEEPKSTTGGDDSGDSYLHSIQVDRRDVARALYITGAMLLTGGGGLAYYASSELTEQREKRDTLKLNEPDNTDKLAENQARIDNHDELFKLGAGTTILAGTLLYTAKSISKNDENIPNQNNDPQPEV